MIKCEGYSRMEEENKIDWDINQVVAEQNRGKKKGKKLKTHQKAKKLVDEAKDMVKASETEMQECKLLLDEDIKEYTAALKELKENALDESMILLSKLDDVELDLKSTQDESSVFEAKDDIVPLVLKDVYSGRFTGILLSLLGGVATFVGLLYWASKNLGITSDLSKVPSSETVQTLFGWFGKLVGRGDDAIVGGVVVGLAVFAVSVFIYLIRVSLKSRANLDFAQAQIRETQEYISRKKDCKAHMDRVDAHIQEAVKVLKDYEILLAEQNGKLQRIFYFEREKNKLSEFSNNSLRTMEETQGLVMNIQDFITTPMSYKGKLSEESESALQSAKVYVEKLLKVWN